MNFPRMRFTVRAMMVAVAIIAALWAIEMFLARRAVELVRERNDAGGWEYIKGEAVLAWTVLHLPHAVLAFFALALWCDRRRKR